MYDVIARRRDLTLLQKVLYSRILSNAEGRSDYDLSFGGLAKDFRCSHTAAGDAMRALERAGLLIVHRTAGEAHRYVVRELIDPKIERADVSESESQSNA